MTKRVIDGFVLEKAVVLCPECQSPFSTEMLVESRKLNSSDIVEADLHRVFSDPQIRAALLACCPACKYCAWASGFKPFKLKAELMRNEAKIEPSKKYALAVKWAREKKVHSLDIAFIALNGLWCTRESNEPDALWLELAIFEHVKGMAASPSCPEDDGMTHLIMGELHRQHRDFEKALASYDLAEQDATTSREILIHQRGLANRGASSVTALPLRIARLYFEIDDSADSAALMDFEPQTDGGASMAGAQADSSGILQDSADKAGFTPAPGADASSAVGQNAVGQNEVGQNAVGQNEAASDSEARPLLAAISSLFSTKGSFLDALAGTPDSDEESAAQSTAPSPSTALPVQSSGTNNTSAPATAPTSAPAINNGAAFSAATPTTVTPVPSSFVPPTNSSVQPASAQSPAASSFVASNPANTAAVTPVTANSSPAVKPEASAFVAPASMSAAATGNGAPAASAFVASVGNGSSVNAASVEKTPALNSTSAPAASSFVAPPPAITPASATADSPVAAESVKSPANPAPSINTEPSAVVSPMVPGLVAASIRRPLFASPSLGSASSFAPTVRPSAPAAVPSGSAAATGAGASPAEVPASANPPVATTSTAQAAPAAAVPAAAIPQAPVATAVPAAAIPQAPVATAVPSSTASAPASSPTGSVPAAQATPDTVQPVKETKATPAPKKLSTAEIIPPLAVSSETSTAMKSAAKPVSSAKEPVKTSQPVQAATPSAASSAQPKNKEKEVKAGKPSAPRSRASVITAPPASSVTVSVTAVSSPINKAGAGANDDKSVPGSTSSATPTTAGAFARAATSSSSSAVATASSPAPPRKARPKRVKPPREDFHFARNAVVRDVPPNRNGWINDYGSRLTGAAPVAAQPAKSIREERVETKQRPSEKTTAKAPPAEAQQRQMPAAVHDAPPSEAGAPLPGLAIDDPVNGKDYSDAINRVESYLSFSRKVYSRNWMKM